MMRGASLVDGYDGASSRWFGKAHEGTRDYQAHLDECQQREQSAEADIEDVVQQLIDESPTFRTPTDATKRLDELNEQKLNKAIIIDTSIDPAVLGPAALPYVLQARLHYQAGEVEKLAQSYEKVVELGVSSSCPTGLNADPSGLEGLSSIFAGEDKYGSLEFKCKNGCLNKRERNGWVYNCQKCGIDVSCGKKPPRKSSSYRPMFAPKTKTKNTMKSQERGSRSRQSRHLHKPRQRRMGHHAVQQAAN